MRLLFLSLLFALSSGIAVGQGNYDAYDLDTTGETSFAIGVTLRSPTAGTPIEFGTATNPIRTDPTGTTTQDTSVLADEYSSYDPDPSSINDGAKIPLSVDYSGNLRIRGPVTTDEGSFRDDFPGTSLATALSGSAQYNGSTSVGGNGSALYTTEVKAGQYIKKTADPETSFRQVDYVESNSQLYLTTAYPSSGVAASVVSNWKTYTPTGGSLSVASSVLSIASGTLSGNIAGIERFGDYLPYNLSFRASISQRIANQDSYIGFASGPTATAGPSARFLFTGTDATKATCTSSSSTAAADLESTLITLPIGTTATSHTYRIDVTSTAVNFTIDDVIVCTHLNHIPSPYDNVGFYALIFNNAVVTTTTMALDWVSFLNSNQIEVTNGFKEPFLVKESPNSSTYSAAVTALSSANNPTDIFTITGSATKTIRVTRVRVDGTQTTSGTANIQIIRRSTANSAGTSTAPTPVAHDSTNVAATAVVRAYTANPTLGTIVGLIRSDREFVPAVTALGEEVIYDFADSRGVQQIVLRGTNEVLSVNLNAVTVTGGLFNISFEWIEE